MVRNVDFLIFQPAFGPLWSQKVAISSLINEVFRYMQENPKVTFLASNLALNHLCKTEIETYCNLEHGQKNETHHFTLFHFFAMCVLHIILFHVL